jgi:hypothetical protein
MTYTNKTQPTTISPEKYLKDAKVSINTTLKQFDTEYIRFNGQVSNISINKIYLTDEGIRFLIFLKGNLQGSYR